MNASRCIAATVAVVLWATAVVGLAAAPTTQTLPAHEPAQGLPGSTCATTAHKSARPSAVLLGELVEVTLSASISCSTTTNLHIVLVLDSSTSMQGAPSAAMRAGARALIEHLDLHATRATYVGVVMFGTAARTICELTNHADLAIGCTAPRLLGGASNIELGIEEGMKVLRRGRGRFTDRDRYREVMVVLADGPDPFGCARALQAAGVAKGEGVLLITVCLGPDCDVNCMQIAATNEQFAFEADHHDQLGAIFESVYRAIEDVGTTLLTITDQVPDNMRLDSVAPAASYDENSRRLTWHLANIGRAGVTVTYQLQPLEVGRWPTNVEADGVFRDVTRAEGRFVFPIPYVSVHNAGVALPTPAGPAPGPTHTLQPLGAGTAPASTLATPTPMPRAGHFLLPVWPAAAR